jgi:hypothetical protein
MFAIVEAVAQGTTLPSTPSPFVSLFNESVSSSDRLTSRGRMMNE